MFAQACVGCALACTAEGSSVGAWDPCCDMLKWARAQVGSSVLAGIGFSKLQKKKNNNQTLFFFLIIIIYAETSKIKSKLEKEK
jgi:hypothetical protein